MRRTRSVKQESTMTEQAENITTERPAPFTLGPGGGRPFALPARGRGTIKLGTPDTGGTLSAFSLSH